MGALHSIAVTGKDILAGQLKKCIHLKKSISHAQQSLSYLFFPFTDQNNS
jgi:hypothetical protein